MIILVIIGIIIQIPSCASRNFSATRGLKGQFFSPSSKIPMIAIKQIIIITNIADGDSAKIFDDKAPPEQANQAAAQAKMRPPMNLPIPPMPSKEVAIILKEVAMNIVRTVSNDTLPGLSDSPIRP